MEPCLLLCGLIISLLGVSQENLRGQRGASFNVSPQGDYLVFTAQSKGKQDIYLFALDTLRVKRVTSSAEYERDPTFSPDGKRIVFAASPTVRAASHLYSCALDGTDRKQLTKTPNVRDAQPTFSANGSLMAFARGVTYLPDSPGDYAWSDWDIYTLKPDGTQLRRVTQQKYSIGGWPSVSPDGTTIVFTALTSLDTAMDILSVDPQGAKPPKQITRNPRTESDPVYSPDGKQIVYISDAARLFEYEIWRMQADETNAAPLALHHSLNWQPRLTPDGKRVFFLSDTMRNMRYELWVMDINGKNLKRVADSRLFDDPLRWKP